MQKFPSSHHWTSQKACCLRNLFQPTCPPALLPHLLLFSPIRLAVLNTKLWHYLKLQGSIYQSVRYSPPPHLLSGYVHKHCIRGGHSELVHISSCEVSRIVLMVGQITLLEVVVLHSFSCHAAQIYWSKCLISSLAFLSGVEQSCHTACKALDDFKDWETKRLRKGLASCYCSCRFLTSLNQLPTSNLVSWSPDSLQVLWQHTRREWSPTTKE